MAAIAFPDDDALHPAASDSDLLDDLLDDERLDPRWLKDLDEPWEPDEPWAPTPFDDGLI